VERYVLRSGRWGYDRLRILARVRRAETLALLGRAGRPADGVRQPANLPALGPAPGRLDLPRPA